MKEKTENIKIAWQPQPGRQTEALTTKAFELLFGGAKFGGKSQAGMGWLLKPFADVINGYFDKSVLERYRALVIRKNADDLREWLDQAAFFYKPAGGEIVGRPAEIRFKCGAKFWTGHLKDQSSYMKYLGWNIPRILVEELELIPNEEDYELLLGACRSPIPEIDARTFGSCNPGNVGNKWIMKRWGIQGKPPYNTITTETPRGLRVFIPSRAEDNPIGIKNDPGYVAYLESLPEARRKAWREGDFTAFVGQFFDLNESVHGVEPFEIPGNWTLWAGLDYGESHPTAFALYARDSANDRVYRICEYVQSGCSASENARNCKSLVLDCKWTNGRMPEKVEAGTDMWVKRSSVKIGDTQVREAFRKSPADEFEEYGFNMRPANTDRVNGWRLCQEYLKYLEFDPITKESIEKEPKFYYFEDNNEEFVATIPAMVGSNTNAEDVKKQDGDDVADEWRYALMGDDGGADYSNLLEMYNKPTKRIVQERY